MTAKDFFILTHGVPKVDTTAGFLQVFLFCHEQFWLPSCTGLKYQNYSTTRFDEKKVSHLKKSILLGNRNCRHISAVH